MKNSKQIIINTSDILAVIAVIISLFSLYLSIKPDDTTLTIQTSELKGCMANRPNCYQLFIYNNDKAPCFELNIDFKKKDFNKVLFITNYKESSLFHILPNSNKISFKGMKTIEMNSSWLGYLDKKEIAYFVFFPSQYNKSKKEVTISCIGYSKTIQLN
ncbi:hypothetical protein Arnit_0193 [Arcobacter nitrofigilis DSM 7299]|uniref:Uncharacterized protein n=1 Tax=Arcobacter nitrofigilis (strain ATCC 33309 / DSM 7299 / CCUG 15893 / LMG 7604 / NCTC 12251 / CI) TaxID=572480 RepID=D5V4C7_ARCNC|nr:hypothetical protein [Arcobacter nitrofigilis]ADG91860.1 hypothetical protein Arnit_0193 [Arcobacter nitrofigilis DSM 7299]